MRKIIVPALAFLLGITVALVIYRSVITARAPASGETARPSALGLAPTPNGPQAPWEPHAKAAQLLQSGQLREAQDVFLEILSRNPRDENALQGLVVVRRYMAGDNPALLRRQAASYWESIKRGVENEEHYSLRAMETLLTATLQAVQAIEARKPATRAFAAPQPLSSPAAVRPPAAVPSQGKPPSAQPPTASLAGPQMPVLSGERAPAPATPPVKPAAPQAAAVLVGKAAAPATPVNPAVPQAATVLVGRAAVPAAPVKPAAPQTPAPAGRKASAPATPPAKPGAPKTPAPASGKAPTPAAAPAKPAAPQTAIPSSAPATREPEKFPGPLPAAAPGGKTPPPAASSQTWAITAPHSSPPPAELSTVNNRMYMVRVGPVSDRDLASAIAKQLSAGGFSQPNVTSHQGFRVVSEPLPRSAAEGLAASLAGRGIHAQIEPLGRDVVHLVFGSFAAQKDAEALSQRVTALGYDAWVREETLYTLQLGPYPQSSVNTISGIVRWSAPGAAVSADLMP